MGYLHFNRPPTTHSRYARKYPKDLVKAQDRYRRSLIRAEEQQTLVTCHVCGRSGRLWDVHAIIGRDIWCGDCRLRDQNRRMLQKELTRVAADLARWGKELLSVRLVGWRKSKKPHLDPYRTPEHLADLRSRKRSPRP